MVTQRRYTVPYLPVGSIFGQAEVDAVARLLMSGERLSCGPERDAFEQEFAAHLGAPYAVAVTNCTVALEIASHLAGLRPGDEVIATPQTYQATIQHLLTADVRVRFCDIDPGSLNADPQSVVALMSDRTKAVYLVHYGGLPVDMDPIMKAAEQYGAVVIEDCAHALGADYNGRMPGTLGHLGCFSFQSYKNISTLGEGGMIVFSDPEWYDRTRRIIAIEPDADFVPRVRSSLGGYLAPVDEVERHAKNAYTEDCVRVRHAGTNSTLSEPQAAVGRIQLRRLGGLAARRDMIATRLDEGLAGVPGLRLQIRPVGLRSAHHLYTCFLDPATGIDRDHLVRLLDERGIQIQLRYFPLHLLPEWRRAGHAPGECPVAERVWFKEQINLPIYPQMRDSHVDFMVRTVAETVDELSR